MRNLQQPGLALALGALALAACGPASVSTTELGDERFNTAMATNAMKVANGLSANGLSANGLSANGLSANGLSANGLSANGLFADWFNRAASTNAQLMSYVYRCAAPQGTTVTWTNPATHVTYSWSGLLGLAPDWVSGRPATLAEQQVISACLGAHVNKYGVHVAIAVEGRDARGVQIPIAPTELTEFSQREACFFGNLFAGQAVFVALDHPPVPPEYSSPRACAIDTQAIGPSVDCPPLYYAGSCSAICRPDATGTFWESCAWNGVAYKPIATRIRMADVYRCGDGVCQFTEKCGTGTSAENCLADCGACP